MGWQPTALSLVAFGAVAISVAVATQVWQQREERGALLFIGLLLAAAGWAGAYGIQLGFTTAAEQLLFQRLGIAIGGSIPTLWLLFALTYSGRDQWLTRRVKALLAVEPVGFAALVLTNPAHGLVWGELTLTETTLGPALEPTFGTVILVHLAYGYLLILAGLAVLFYVFVRNPTVYRTQAVLLMLAAIVPLSANMAFVAGLSRGPFPVLDPTPFTFVVTAVLVGLAFFRFDLLTRVPVARQHVLTEMGDGLLVLDIDGEVVDANAVAHQVLAADALVGRPVTALFDPGTTTEATLGAVDGRTLTASVDGSDQAYDVRCVALTDNRGERIGHVVSLRNVTDRNRYEQRLEVTQRVLRHNLRNDVSVIQAHAEQLARDGHPEAEHIVETAEKLVDLSEKARLITHIEGREEDMRVPVDVSEHLSRLCVQFREAYPDVTVDCTVPAGLTASLQDPALLAVPVENVLENAAIHNDSADPRVAVSAERADDVVRLRVADNGPEIPEMELTALESGTESALQHGSSLGLWLSYWGVRTAGGDISFETGIDGNVVTLAFPAGPGDRPDRTPD